MVDVRRRLGRFVARRLSHGDKQLAARRHAEQHRVAHFGWQTQRKPGRAAERRNRRALELFARILQVDLRLLDVHELA
jgi:hypothetical protein